MVAHGATMSVACCKVNDMNTQTCRSKTPRENRGATLEDQDCLASRQDFQQHFKQLQLQVMADVELKLQEHIAHLRKLLVEEVRLQIMSKTVRPGAANADDGIAPATAEFGQADGDGCGGCVNSLRGLCSPNRSLQKDLCSPSRSLQKDAGSFELKDPRAETQRRLSAIEQQLRSRKDSVDQLHSPALVATVASNRRDARDSEVPTKDQWPWPQKQQLRSSHDLSESTFLGLNEADARVCSDETRAPSRSPLPSHRTHEATEQSPYESSPGNSSTTLRTKRHASPELTGHLERRRSMNEGQIAQQAYGAFMRQSIGAAPAHHPGHVQMPLVSSLHDGVEARLPSQCSPR